MHAWIGLDNGREAGKCDIRGDNTTHHVYAIMEPKDSLGNVLATGDTVKLTKDLKVSGSQVTLKGGQVIKKIRITDDPEEIDCKVDGIKITVKTAFVRKVQ